MVEDDNHGKKARGQVCFGLSWQDLFMDRMGGQEGKENTKENISIPSLKLFHWSEGNQTSIALITLCSNTCMYKCVAMQRRECE